MVKTRNKDSLVYGDTFLEMVRVGLTVCNHSSCCIEKAVQKFVVSDLIFAFQHAPNTFKSC